jgi:hypothetical protein
MAELEFTNKLLKEAIADAEAVRQTAIENAKLSLEETFTPQIKSMLERKLRAEAEGMGEEEMEEATELPLEDGEPEGSSEMPADSSDIGAGDNKEPSPEAFDSAEDDMSGEGHTDSSTDWYEDWTDSDFDLDEVIKELEEDVKLLEGEGEEKEEEKEDEKEEESEAEGEEDEDKGEYPEGEPAGVEGDEPPADSSDIGEKDAAKFTLDEFLSMMQEAGYDVHEMGFDQVLPAAEPPMEEGEVEEISAGTLQKAADARQAQASKATADRVALAKSSPNTQASMDANRDTLRGMAVKAQDAGERAAKLRAHAASKVEETDLNLEEILAMLEAEDAGQPESEEMASEVQALQEELAEYREALGILRGKLHEVNLLNAKLLYTNKIFRKEGLTNEQKVTIVENFDRATTIREVKMVYAVLAESLVPQKSIKTTAGAKKIVAEGLASKPTPSTAPKTEAPEVIAENSVAKRLQQLAGIIS